jgi:hypothetical protein
MLPVGFEPAIPASERPQTHALYRAATKNGPCNIHLMSAIKKGKIRFVGHTTYNNAIRRSKAFLVRETLRKVSLGDIIVTMRVILKVSETNRV